MVIVAGYPGNYSNYQQNFYNSVNQGLQKVLGSQVLHIYCILYYKWVSGDDCRVDMFLSFSVFLYVVSGAYSNLLTGEERGRGRSQIIEQQKLALLTASAMF